MLQQHEQWIKQLTETDTKTLVQQTLKTVEEVGELAKVVLPFDNAAGTIHRFATKQQILEEAIDTLLCSASIVYGLGMTDEEINEMMVRKLTKWSSIQARESKVNTERIPFEIHITVKIVDQSQIELFKQVCAEIGVKPILLDLHNTNAVVNDMMTSSTLVSSNAGAYYNMKRISNLLAGHGFIVLREKIETVPWHPLAPLNGETMPQNCYFECHFGVIVNSVSIEQLKQVAPQLELHLSKNAFKQLSDDDYVIMATYRDYKISREEFEENVQCIKNALVNHEFTLEREIVEFSIYDTNISHDFNWLKGT